jgi:two-component system KDP operon response regulator KdpE
MSLGRVLVVDDEPQIRRVLRSTLAARGYEVHEARTGEDALEYLRQNRLDLVLLDVNMPGMGGLETCREIRASFDVAIIMLTVNDSEKDKVAALDAGADDYVTKPFGMLELLARIRAALRRLPMATDRNDAPLELGELQVNLVLRQVTVKGHDIRLTPKEFDLLHYLIVNANVPISHSKLLKAVWGPDHGDQVQYLRVFVNQLRKKIEPEPSQPRYIVTEPWVGYRFAVAPKA